MYQSAPKQDMILRERMYDVLKEITSGNEYYGKLFRGGTMHDMAYGMGADGKSVSALNKNRINPEMGSFDAGMPEYLSADDISDVLYERYQKQLDRQCEGLEYPIFVDPDCGQYSGKMRRAKMKMRHKMPSEGYKQTKEDRAKEEIGEEAYWAKKKADIMVEDAMGKGYIERNKGKGKSMKKMAKAYKQNKKDYKAGAKKNPWILFLEKNKGKGHSMAQLRAMYKKKKGGAVVQSTNYRRKKKQKFRKPAGTKSVGGVAVGGVAVGGVVRHRKTHRGRKRPKKKRLTKKEKLKEAKATKKVWDKIYSNLVGQESLVAHKYTLKKKEAQKAVLPAMKLALEKEADKIQQTYIDNLEEAIKMKERSGEELSRLSA
jgi:hypothetical protein